VIESVLEIDLGDSNEIVNHARVPIPNLNVQCCLEWESATELITLEELRSRCCLLLIIDILNLDSSVGDSDVRVVSISVLRNKLESLENVDSNDIIGWLEQSCKIDLGFFGRNSLLVNAELTLELSDFD